MNSRFEYVRGFEEPDRLLPNAWIVIRIDGRHFHQFCDAHAFQKPNDDLGIALMTRAAQAVMHEFSPNVILAIGQSDEYSFVLPRHCTLFNRRKDKLISSFTSVFTANYVLQWNQVFPVDQKLQFAPSFDGRAVLYPTDENVRDYLKWRQADTHINNLYNVCFWTLVNQANKTPQQAKQELEGTNSDKKKHGILSAYDIKYSDLPAMHRKGTILAYVYREKEVDQETKREEFKQFREKKQFERILQTFHEDLCHDNSPFWQNHPYLIPHEPFSAYKKRITKEARTTSTTTTTTTTARGEESASVTEPSSSSK